MQVRECATCIHNKTPIEKEPCKLCAFGGVNQHQTKPNDPANPLPWGWWVGVAHCIGVQP